MQHVWLLHETVEASEEAEVEEGESEQVTEMKRGAASASLKKHRSLLRIPVHPAESVTACVLCGSCSDLQTSAAPSHHKQQFLFALHRPLMSLLYEHRSSIFRQQLETAQQDSRHLRQSFLVPVHAEALVHIYMHTQERMKSSHQLR